MDPVGRCFRNGPLKAALHWSIPPGAGSHSAGTPGSASLRLELSTPPRPGASEGRDLGSALGGAVLFQAVLQRSKADAEFIGGCLSIATVAFQAAQDRFLFQFSQRFGMTGL